MSGHLLEEGADPEAVDAAMTQFGFPMGPDHIDETELNGASDYPSIWRQGPREGMQLHWDGNNDRVEERNLNASLATSLVVFAICAGIMKKTWFDRLEKEPAAA